MAPFSFGDEPLHAGQTATVMCFVSEGDLPVELTWWLNGAKIGDDRTDVSMVSTKKSTMLTIDSVSGELAGNYSCMARNWAGVAQYTTELVVNGL